MSTPSRPLYACQPQIQGWLQYLDVGLEVEVLDLTGDLAGKGAGIELGDAVDTRAAREQIGPGRLHRVAHGTDAAQAGHDDTAAAHGGSGLLVRLGVVDRLLHGGDLLGVLVRDLRFEFLFQGHDQLDRVERVRAEVVDEGSVVGDFFLLYPQLFGDDGFNLLFDTAHWCTSPL